jgi:hypothetical protein
VNNSSKRKKTSNRSHQDVQEQQEEEMEDLGCLSPSHDHVLDFTNAAVVDRK